LIAFFNPPPHPLSPTVILFRFLSFGPTVNMKSAIATTAMLATLAVASSHGLERRQLSSDDLSRGACKEVLFICARGSTEPGNMVREAVVPKSKRLEKFAFEKTKIHLL
jgi:hypothetical protein